MLFRFVTNGVQQVRFAEAGTAVKKKRVIGIARRTAHRHTTGVRQPVTRADDKIGERVIRMKLQFAILPLPIRRRTARLQTEIDAYQVARYLLCGTGKGSLAVIAKEFDCRIIRAANLQQPAVKMSRRQVVEPLAGINRVDDL